MYQHHSYFACWGLNFSYVLGVRNHRKRKQINTKDNESIYLDQWVSGLLPPPSLMMENISSLTSSQSLLPWSAFLLENNNLCGFKTLCQPKIIPTSFLRHVRYFCNFISSVISRDLLGIRLRSKKACKTGGSTLRTPFQPHLFQTFPSFFQPTISLIPKCTVIALLSLHVFTAAVATV